MAEIRDVSSESVPTIAQMRESQKKGQEGKGTNAEDTRLNSAQNHDVDTKD